MHRILIVEDEPLIAADISRALKKVGYDIAGSVGNADEAIDILSSQSVDVVILDITIDGELDGIELGEKINQDHFIPFLFLTSYYDDQTLQRAGKTNPAGYIVKPFDDADLIANVKLALFKEKKQVLITDKFFVREKSGLIALEPNDILYAESDNNYANIYTHDHKYVVTHTLKGVEESLGDKGFLRVHKSYLINFRKISRIQEGYVFLGTHKIPIGRAHKEQLLKNLAIL